MATTELALLCGSSLSFCDPLYSPRSPGLRAHLDTVFTPISHTKERSRAPMSITKSPIPFASMGGTIHVLIHSARQEKNNWKFTAIPLVKGQRSRRYNSNLGQPVSILLYVYAIVING